MKTLLATVITVAAFLSPWALDRLLTFITKDRHPTDPGAQWENILKEMQKKNEKELRRISKQKKQKN